MTTDDHRDEKEGHGDDKGTTNRPSSWLGGIFTVPPAVERLFASFPLVLYSENALPVRAPKPKEESVLYVFATESGARAGKPSFNPTCLKWQTYLKFSKSPFTIAPSSNHASPSGALPFLLPASPTEDLLRSKAPITTKTMRKWLGSQQGVIQPVETSDHRYEAYMSLLEGRIRKAWLYQLYLSDANTSVVRQLYVDPCSSNTLVRTSIDQQLRQAAALEIVKASTSGIIVEEEIMREAEDALDALSCLLGEDRWFFGQPDPGLFDANVFAYTHLLQDELIDWNDNPLLSLLQRHANLMRHQTRIAEMYF